MDKKKLAAINAAVQAYMNEEAREVEVSSGRKLNAWKMAARRDVTGRSKLAQRADPARYRLRRFVLF